MRHRSRVTYYFGHETIVPADDEKALPRTTLCYDVGCQTYFAEGCKLPSDQHAYRDWEQGRLEGAAHGAITGDRGPARAELLRRDREYAEEQEKSRRNYEDERDVARRSFEAEMFDAAGKREAARQKFEEELAKRQMDHAAALAREQLDTAQAAASAAKMAAWAAVAAALGAIGQVIVAVLK
jgi:hypothetical protein